jgi:hypothetical protein
MDSIISKLGTEEILALAGMVVGVIAILGGITVAITQVVSSHRRRMQLDEMDATLKMEMIQRGMSAEEIDTVLRARSSSRKIVNLNFSGMSPGCKKWPGFAKQHEKV